MNAVPCERSEIGIYKESGVGVLGAMAERYRG